MLNLGESIYITIDNISISGRGSYPEDILDTLIKPNKLISLILYLIKIILYKSEITNKIIYKLKITFNKINKYKIKILK